ncbi:hypothetical protein AB0K74_39635 [Streptomyces sp. NPDC056159]
MPISVFSAVEPKNFTVTGSLCFFAACATAAAAAVPSALCPQP